MLFQFVQIIYWLALSAWFGATLSLLVAPPIILRSVRDANPLLPGVLSVNLDGQHGTLLAGSIVGNLIAPVHRIELGCAGALLLAIVAQWFVARPSQAELAPAILRSSLYLAAVAFLLYDWRVLWPKIWRSRQTYIDNADNPPVANPALDEFDRHQAESFTMLRNLFFVLLGIILFSAWIRPTAQMLQFQ